MATEGLADAAGALNGIKNAVNVAKSIQENREGIIRIVDETRRQANELSSLDFKDGYPVDVQMDFQILQGVMSTLGESGEYVLQAAPNSAQANREFEENVLAMINMDSREDIPAERVSKLCNQLERVYEMAVNFSKQINEFVDHLDEAQQKATELENKVTDLARKAEQEADSRVSTGNKVSVGLVASTVALAALGLFTGGVGLIGAAAVAGAGAVGTQAYTKASESGLREQAGKFAKDVANLEEIARGIRRNYERAKKIQLNEEFINSMKLALSHYRHEEAKNTQIAQLQEQMQKNMEEDERKARRIAELEEQAQRRHENAERMQSRTCELL